MLEGLPSIFGTGGLGLASGLVGSIVTAITNYKMQKIKFEHDEKMALHDREMIRLETDKAVKIITIQEEGKVEQGELKALEASYQDANKSLFDASYMKWIMKKPNWFGYVVGVLISILFALTDVAKHAARPFITYYLLAASSVLTLLCYKIAATISGQPLEPKVAFSLFQLAVQTLLYLTVTVITWHFADRRMAKFLTRLNDGNFKPEAPF